jgi:hypothetical protein
MVKVRVNAGDAGRVIFVVEFEAGWPLRSLVDVV